MRFILGSPQTIEAVHELEEALEHRKRDTLIAGLQNEREYIENNLNMQEVESQNIDSDDHNSHNQYDNEIEPKDEHQHETENQVDNSELQYTEEQQNTEQGEIHVINNEEQIRESSQHYDENVERVSYLQASGSPSRPKQPFYPKYINKREKMQMLMRNPAFVDINQEVSSPIAERKIEILQINNKSQDPNFIIEPSPNLPEEKGVKVNSETPFIEDYEEESPRKLGVSAQKSAASRGPYAENTSYPDTWQKKSKTLRAGSKPEDANSTANKGYPLEYLHDEKSFIKKNIDNYQTLEHDEPNYFVKDVFAELGVKPGYENDVVMERLKQRYESAYRENFLIDKGQLRQNERNRGRSTNLLGSFKGSNANNLSMLDEEFGSESFREYKRMHSPGGVYAALRTGENVGYVKPTIPTRRTRRTSERPHIPLFELFEQEIPEIAATAKERLSTVEGTFDLASVLSNKSLFAQKQKSLPQ